MEKLVVVSRRTLLAIAIVAVVSVAVSAALLSSFLVPSNVTITSAPGITVHQVNLDNTPGAVVTSFEFGDCQQGLAVSKQVIVKNSAGTLAQFLIAGQSLTTQPTPLPVGVTLTWNFLDVYTAGYIGLGVGSYTSPLTLTLSCTSQAAPGILSFITEFRSFSTNTG